MPSMNFIADGMNFIPNLAQALGLPVELLRKITLEVSSDSLAVVTAEYLESTENDEEVVSLLKKYCLVEIEKSDG